MKQTLVLFSIALLFVLAIAGCKEDTPAGPGPSPGITVFVGTLANSAETGSMRLTFSSAIAKYSPFYIASPETVISVSGTVTINGTVITLTGTYDTETTGLQVSGGGYTFSGTLSDGHITGTYTGPNGPGGFSAAPSSTDGSVKVYCGTSHETSPDTSNHGRFNLVISGTEVSGITDDGLELGGSVSGSTVSVTIFGTAIGSGTISGTSIINGTYSFTNEVTYTGTWEAELCE